MLVSLTLQSNLPIPVLQKYVNKNQQTSSENKKDTYLNAEFANKGAYCTYHRPTYHLQAAKKQLKQGQYKKKPISGNKN